MVLLFLIQYLKVKKQVLAATKKRQKHIFFVQNEHFWEFKLLKLMSMFFFKPAALKQMTWSS